MYLLLRVFLPFWRFVHLHINIFYRRLKKIGLVTEPITRLEPGEVKVDGKRWSAIANKKIKKDSKVEILAIDGVKLVVKEIKEEEEK